MCETKERNVSFELKLLVIKGAASLTITNEFILYVAWSIWSSGSTRKPGICAALDTLVMHYG